MTIFDKYPKIGKHHLTILQGVVSKLYDAGKTSEQIVEITELPEELVNNMIAIKERADKNRNRMKNEKES